MKLMTPKQVIAAWAKYCSTKRGTKKKAREFATKCGMRSMGEVICAADMDKRGIKYKYEAEKVAYQLPPQKYTPDFRLLDTPDLIIEYKGYMRVGVPKKMIAIQNSNPDRQVCIVFQNPNLKYSKTMKYWQWAEKNGFLWSAETINEEWLNGNT
jgi:hypothetical protein